MNKVIEIGLRGGGLAQKVCVALSPDIRWCSKVAEIKAMGTPGLEKIFQEKISSGKISLSSILLATLRF